MDGQPRQPADGPPPGDTGSLRVSPPPAAATGLTAIAETAKVGLRQMGLKRSLATLLHVNQRQGFDCPSCAWPEPDDRRAIAEFCENGAKAVASEATLARAGPDLFARHSIADLLAKSDRWLNDAGRLTHPMLLREGATHYELISWDDAFTLIAAELRSLASPDEAAFYTSGRTSNEA